MALLSFLMFCNVAEWWFAFQQQPFILLISGGNNPKSLTNCCVGCMESCTISVPMSESVFVLKQTCYITNSNSVEALTSSTIKNGKWWNLFIKSVWLNRSGQHSLVHLILFDMANNNGLYFERQWVHKNYSMISKFL